MLAVSSVSGLAPCCTVSFTCPYSALSQGVFKYCELGAFVEDYNFLDTMLIFMLYGWSAVPLMYLGSYLFSSSTAAYIKLTLFNYFSTVFSIIVDTIMHVLGKDFPHFPFSPGNILNKSG